MIPFVFRRFLATIPVLAIVLIFIFSLVRMVPGDPAVTLLGPGATETQIEALRAQLDLDKPLGVQFFSYLGGVLQGDLGVSLNSGRPVGEELLQRLPATIELSVVALICAILVGIPLGVFSATRPDTALDQGLRVVSLVGVSIPAFLFALVLQLVFGLWLGWLPISGRISPFVVIEPVTGFLILDGFLLGTPSLSLIALTYVILPASVLAAFLAAVLSRFVRSAMLEAMEEEYIRTARAKGLAERSVVYGHALRNALLPAITVLGLAFAEMLGGAILTETIFAWPGIGRYMFEAIRNRDYPVIQGTTLLFAVIFIVTALVVDLIHGWLDPRVRKKLR